jgi:hypothetical protein
MEIVNKISNKYMTFRYVSDSTVPVFADPFQSFSSSPSLVEQADDEKNGVFETAKALSKTYEYTDYELRVARAMPVGLAAHIVQLSRPYTM